MLGVHKMKRVITILIVISIIAIGLMLFLPDNYTWTLLPFAIPLMLGPFSLAVKRDKIQPKTWLIIYGIAVAVYLVVTITSYNFDIPFAWD